MATILSKPCSILAAFTFATGWCPLAVAGSPVKEPLPEQGVRIEGDIDTSAAIQRMSEKLTALENETIALQNQILTLQDRLAANHTNVKKVNIAVEVDLNGKTPALGLIDLTASLNGHPLVRHRNPQLAPGNSRVPLYAGPMPHGTFEIRLTGVVGRLQHGWPHALAQGQWLLKAVENLTISSESPSEFLFVLRMAEPSPTLTLAKSAEIRK